MLCVPIGVLSSISTYSALKRPSHIVSSKTAFSLSSRFAVSFSLSSSGAGGSGGGGGGGGSGCGGVCGETCPKPLF